MTSTNYNKILFVIFVLIHIKLYIIYLPLELSPLPHSARCQSANWQLFIRFYYHKCLELSLKSLEHLAKRLECPAIYLELSATSLEYLAKSFEFFAMSLECSAISLDHSADALELSAISLESSAIPLEGSAKSLEENY